MATIMSHTGVAGTITVDDSAVSAYQSIGWVVVSGGSVDPTIAQTRPFGWNRRWLADRESAASGLVTIAAITDSIGTGWVADSPVPAGETWMDWSWVRKMAATLQARYGNGGTGWIPASYIPTARNSLVPGQQPGSKTGGGWRSTQFGTAGTPATGLFASQFGPNGDAIQPLTPGDDSTATFPAMNGTTMQVWYWQDASQGTFGVSIDGGSYTAVNAAGATGYAHFDVTGLTAGSHTVTVKTTAGTCMIFGCRSFNATGVLVDNFCLDGRLIADATAKWTIDKITMTATGGTWTVGYAGRSTAALANNVSAANLQTALNALIDPSGLTAPVTVTLASGVYWLWWVGGVFGGRAAPTLTVNAGSLTGGTATATRATTGGDSDVASSTLAVSATGTPAPSLVIASLGVNDSTLNAYRGADADMARQLGALYRVAAASGGTGGAPSLLTVVQHPIGINLGPQYMQYRDANLAASATWQTGLYDEFEDSTFSTVKWTTPPTTYLSTAAPFQKHPLIAGHTHFADVVASMLLGS